MHKGGFNGIDIRVARRLLCDCAVSCHDRWTAAIWLCMVLIRLRVGVDNGEHPRILVPEHSRNMREDYTPAPTYSLSAMAINQA